MSASLARPHHVRRAQRRTRRIAGAALAFTAIIALTTACNSDDPSADGSGTAPAAPTEDVVSSVTKDDAVANLLPAEIRSSGKLIIGGVEAPGVANLPLAGEVDGKQVGLHQDLTNAVAKVLGVTPDYQYGTFATIVPGVENGRYQVGQANFSVTNDRKKVVDFATFVNDGQGFLAPTSLGIDKVTKITDACGYRIATVPGSSFQTLIEQNVNSCKEAGKKNWTVEYFADSAPIVLGIQNGKVDLYFGPSLGLKYAAQRIPDTKYLGGIFETPVGFVTKKGSPIVKALNAAVNRLIDTGDYRKIFEKWGVVDSGVTRSEINPETPL